MSSVGEESGSLLGSSLVSKLKGIIAAAGIGAIVKEALSAGGDLQQSFGGLDTLYGEASQAAKDYAKEAQSAGISMNDYAEQAVSFGAALKSAYGGDVTAAAEAANTAIMDMADNSAKMGTDIESVQAAYQGFAKQNYTLLDNLKLGYGGTKSEMERLLSDAEELSGVHYDIDNLGDVYSAIHVIQEDLGLTGVAAEEASTTFTGSFGAMKAAATNFLAELTTGGDVQGALTTLISSAGTFLFDNLIPMLTDLLTALPGTVVTLIQQGVPTILAGLQEMLSSISGSFNLEEFLSKGVELVTNFANGIMQNAPEAIAKVGEIINNILNYLLSNMPMILQKGFELITNLAQGIINNLPAIVTAIAQVIAKLTATIVSHLPEIIQKGIEIIAKLVVGLIQAIPRVVAAIPQIITAIKNAFTSYDWGSLGMNIINGIKDGILGGVSAIADAAKEAASSALTAAKNLLKIKSPSRVFRDQVGAMIPAGMAVGIETNISDVTDAMDSLTAETLNASVDSVGTISYGATAPVVNNQSDLSSVVALLQQYLPGLSNQKIVLDSGALVGGTVSKMDEALGKLAVNSQRGVFA